jgi:hypothetical protein
MHENRETSEKPAARKRCRTAGEGHGRTARVYVTEESDSGILPMNHSNKDGKPLAESEEGRPLIKENACQPNKYPTQSEKGVSQGLAGVRKAARENKERLGFQNRADAERFLQEWRGRLQKFGLELHPDKTRRIEFGRFAATNRKERGKGKPETCNFLGFTHRCGQTRKNGKFLAFGNLRVGHGG